MEELTFVIQTYTHKELAAWYRCSERTFTNWVKRIREALGQKLGNAYSPDQVEVIVKTYGVPRRIVNTRIDIDD